MKVQILGSGCDRCKRLAANVKLAAEQYNIPCEIEKVEDINEITGFGVMMTPALVVNGKVVSVGKVLSSDEIAKLLGTKTCDCGGTCSTSSHEQFLEPCCCEAKETASCCCGRGKKLMTIVLLVFVVASVVFMVLKQIKSNDAVASASFETEQVTSSTPQNINAMVVYYFHGNQRCFTCNKIEELTELAIETKYAKEVADGNVIFKSVNVEEPVNEHFIKDFQLSTRSVVMQKNGEYKKFDAVWNLVREPQKFAEYIQNGVAEMLK